MATRRPWKPSCLEDAQARDVEAIFGLGDMGGFGPHPDRALARLRQSGAEAIQGNYDEALARSGSSIGASCATAPRLINEFLCKSTTTNGLVRRLCQDTRPT
jgi:hypothetical protein